MSRAMTRRAARPSPPRAMPPKPCPAMAGCNGSAKARLSARWKRCSPLSAPRFTPATKAAGRKRAMGWRPRPPSWAAPSSKAAGEAQAALAELRGPLIRLGLRLEALLAEPPDWLDGPGRARIEGARHSLAWRVDLLGPGRRCSNATGRPGRPRFRRLAGRRSQRCARIRCRAAPPLARSDEALRARGAGALARGDGDLRRRCAMAMTGTMPLPAAARRTLRSRPASPHSTARSTMPRRLKC